MSVHIVRIVLVVVAVTIVSTSHAAAPEWSGDGSVRVIVEVPPVDLHGRERDEMVASYAIDFEKVLREQNIAGAAKLSSLQVHRIDANGKPMKFTDGETFKNSRTPFDRPCRFDDNEMPENFLARTGRSSESKDGMAPQINRPRKGRLFNREVLPKTGKIVWVHTQDGQQPSRYAIYFDVRAGADASSAWQVSPAPWIGDADVLRSETGQSLDGWSHPALTVGDLNGDGLFDIISGTEKGNLIWFPNHGKPGEPKFLGCRVLFDETGPIDTGFYCAPFLFDWDNDGLVDVLAGTNHNVMLWWKNIGTKSEPKLSYKSFVRVGDKRLEVPQEPVPEDYGKKTFVVDYYNQPWVGDYDGDNLPDIITGGYTTGQIFHYRGIGRADDGTPKLEFAGRVEADGKPIDTTWGAAPTLADFDGDGLPELVTGSWWWSGIEHDPEPGQVEFLMYYKNVGTRREPRFTRAPMPRAGEFPDGTIVRPSPVDWNNDGLPDLLVANVRGDVYLFLNEGSAKQPKWRINREQLTIPWGFVRNMNLTAWPANITGDARPEFLTQTTFFAVAGSPYSPSVTQLGKATVNGKPIHHPGPGYGDPYAFTYPHDWDRDGKPDLLWGTQQGNVYLHRARGSSADGKTFDFDEGVMLKSTDGQPVKVGPPVVASREQATDFIILQGSRIRMLVTDYDGDKIDDLLVTETYGNVFLYRNTRAGGVDTLAPPILLTKLSNRTYSLNVIDWNHDDKPDLLIQGNAAEPIRVAINETRDGKPALAKPSTPFKLPYMFWNTRYGTTDWNGDGDEDLLACGDFFTFFVERSFLDHDYRRAELVSVTRRSEQE